MILDLININLPRHLFSFQIKPSSHTHWYDPIVFLHVECEPQIFSSSLHSSPSVNESRKVS